MINPKALAMYGLGFLIGYLWFGIFDRLFVVWWRACRSNWAYNYFGCQPTLKKGQTMKVDLKGDNVVINALPWAYNSDSDSMYAILTVEESKRLALMLLNATNYWGDYETEFVDNSGCGNCSGNCGSCED